MNKSIVLTIVLLVASLSSISIVNASTEPPLPYCDKVFNQSCYDRQDTDDITGLAPCNDGTQVRDYHDCPDATESRNITAFVHLNEQAIKQDTYLGDIWWTVDGKNAASSTYDMSDAVYGDSSEPDDDVLRTGYSDELLVAGNASKICLEEREQDPEYKVCDFIKADTTEMHFTYPASWQPDKNQAQTRNITSFVHLNEEAINSNGNLDHGGRYIVDGKNYSDWTHDMIEWVYPDEADAGPNFDTIEDELMVADNASEICFEDIGSYRSCNYINGRAENATEIHFSYPASWVSN